MRRRRRRCRMIFKKNGKQNYTKGNGKDPSTVGKGREGKEMEKTKNMMEQNIQRVQDARLEERKEQEHGQSLRRRMKTNEQQPYRQKRTFEPDYKNPGYQSVR